jgi:hypothetical protein
MIFIGGSVGREWEMQNEKGKQLAALANSVMLSPDYFATERPDQEPVEPQSGP